MSHRALRFDLPERNLVVAIAEAGSLGKAAQALPLALSAASNRLRLLEDRLGTRLFERGAAGVQATPADRADGLGLGAARPVSLRGCTWGNGRMFSRLSP